MATEKPAAPSVTAPLPGPLSGGLPESLAKQLRLPPAPAPDVDAYWKRVRETFGSLKGIIDARELESAAISLGPSDERALPLCALHVHDGELIADLARWRAANDSAYPSRFSVTLDGTAAWVESLVEADDRILFLVMAGGRRIGQMGFGHALNEGCDISAYNWLRGVGEVRPGIMGRACSALLDWCWTTIRPRRILATPFTDNPVLHGLERQGFCPIAELPLRRHEFGDRVEFRYRSDEDDRPPDQAHMFMVWTPPPTADSSPLSKPSGGE